MFKDTSPADRQMLPKLQVVILLLTLGKTVSKTVQISSACFQCICEATIGIENDYRCNTNEWNCYDGDERCGPYLINQKYWEMSGRPMTDGFQAPLRQKWASCVTQADCARDVILGWALEEQRDCDGNGKIDCDDFVQIHLNAVNNAFHYHCYKLSYAQHYWYNQCKRRNK